MNFNIPSFINFNKFLLVEEIALFNNPALIHYGKCTIIGFLSSYNCIQSISIPNIKSEYRLSDAAISLKIFMENHPKHYINSTVQIYGEVRLFDPKLKLSLRNFESAHSLVQRLRALQIELERKEGLLEREPSGINDKRLTIATRFKLEKEIQLLKHTYQPIVVVNDIKHQPFARELIVENLLRRQIQMKKRIQKKVK